MLLDSRVAARKGGHPYSFFFCSVPHLTAFYRILPLPTSFYRFLPIRGPLSVLQSDNGRITIGQPSAICKNRKRFLREKENKKIKDPVWQIGRKCANGRERLPYQEGLGLQNEDACQWWDAQNRERVHVKPAGAKAQNSFRQIAYT